IQRRVATSQEHQRLRAGGAEPDILAVPDAIQVERSVAVQGWPIKATREARDEPPCLLSGNGNDSALQEFDGPEDIVRQPCSVRARLRGQYIARHRKRARQPAPVPGRWQMEAAVLLCQM